MLTKPHWQIFGLHSNQNPFGRLEVAAGGSAQSIRAGLQSLVNQVTRHTMPVDSANAL